MGSSGSRAVFAVGYNVNQPSPWQPPGDGALWAPRADVCETPEAAHYEIEVPGSSREKLKLHFEAGQLIIEGERDAPHLPTPRRCLQVEIEHGPFRRALPVPPDADAAGIVAHYEAGVLYITVPRRVATETATVKIVVT